MSKLADDYKELLGGDEVSNIERTDKLYEVLRETPVQTETKDLEEALPSELGFLPITEFDEQVRRIGPLFLPTLYKYMFDDLRLKETKISTNKNLPEHLFDFSKEELALMDGDMRAKLIPDWVRQENS